MSLISRRTILASSAALPLLSLPMVGAPAPGSYGQVRRQSAALDALIDITQPVDQIGWGYAWAEGPVWVKDGGYLLFSDPRTNTIYQWTPGTTPVEFLKPSGLAGDPNPALREPGSNGLAIDAAGALVMADSGTRAIAKVDLKTKKKTLLVDKFEGKRLNSPNDLCIAKSGAIYFTDPPYGLADGDTSAVKELPFSGVYRLDPNGTLVVLDKELPRPNGIALSPDDSTLYVTCSDKTKPVLKAYALGPDGLVTSSSILFDFTALMTPEAKGNPDGLKVDQDGNLFVGGPGGILVLSKEGKLLGLIAVTGRSTPNCAFGEDGSTLFICATDIVARIKLKTKAANWG
jgi:gluconolactonase